MTYQITANPRFVDPIRDLAHLTSIGPQRQQEVPPDAEATTVDFPYIKPEHPGIAHSRSLPARTGARKTGNLRRPLLGNVASLLFSHGELGTVFFVKGSEQLLSFTLYFFKPIVVCLHHREGEPDQKK